jgi:hypothetical protein
MKNIHIIPTDKPTGIFESKNGLHFSIIKKIRYGEFKGFHIYITNDEEIKEGDWFVQVNTKKIIKHHPKNGLLLQPQSFDKKIILTTDANLIKNGVQDFDDTFLEWFVKNPSCEFVEVDTYSKKIGVETDTNGYREMDVFGKDYKIIIPQEEPKKEVTGVDDNRPKPNYCYAKEQGHGEIGCVFPACHCGLPIKQEEPLQETFEEAAEKKYPLKGELEIHFYMVRRLAFIDGAKWQQERMYSEEEVRQMFNRYNEIIAHRDIEEWQPWIEKQFKKK